MSAKLNLAASVAARLLNRARQEGSDYQALLTAYCLERFLFRVGASEKRNHFVLKGAMLLRLWSDQPYRATRDLDLLRRGPGEQEAVRQDILAILETPVGEDAVVFHGSAIQCESIRAEDEYAGIRVTLPAAVGNARIPLQIDIGVGDAVWPDPEDCSYPTLLDFPSPDVLVYPREAVIAEKLEAIVVLGERNSRIKDFFDLHYLATHFEFDRAVLGEAVRRTFSRRNTAIPAETPIGLTAAYWQNPSRQPQVRAFARRAGVDAPERPQEHFVQLLHDFLEPVLRDAQRQKTSKGTWATQGRWK
ncbi:nucleotidyl transferase AbiEii/AbiGii toxin family protein [Ramlibacter albus]|uniref:Nucleotidyl transferase AbiEii/AbiGii toxin family protein n=1 Tax=Ramlibacter albus TaxID=2079448 RepID=A0A923M9H8_9BURK|nr:nucleotidyl transferase AbiEii/AbiGii toxin family protein [Ramlibacter albus]MBC5765373.1 nucleotidyl transferase AbiEii/AbiGii toxin family protein [Ramlibacter albus]